MTVRLNGLGLVALMGGLAPALAPGSAMAQSMTMSPGPASVAPLGPSWSGFSMTAEAPLLSAGHPSVTYSAPTDLALPAAAAPHPMLAAPALSPDVGMASVSWDGESGKATSVLKRALAGHGLKKTIARPVRQTLLTIEEEKEPVSFADGSLKKVLEKVKGRAPVADEDAYDPAQQRPFVDCVESREVRNVFFCLFNSQKAQNIALLRASAYAEDGLGILTHAQMFGSEASDDIKNELRHVGGHDISGDKLAEFLDGYRKLHDEKSLATPEARAYLAMEREFLETVVAPKVKAHGSRFVIISGPASAGDKVLPVMGHEFLHAQFFMDPKFKEATMACLRSLENDPDRKALLKPFFDTLKAAAYPMIDTDTVLRANELMAYMLMPEAERFFATHRLDEFKALAPLVGQLRPYVLDFIRNYRSGDGWRLDPIIIGT